jgi:hypothetical protein
MKTRKTQQHKILAVIPSARAQEFLIELANLRDDWESVKRFNKKYTDMIPSTLDAFKVNTSKVISMNGKAEFLSEKELKSIKTFTPLDWLRNDKPRAEQNSKLSTRKLLERNVRQIRDLLRLVWREQDLRTKEYLLFLLQQRIIEGSVLLIDHITYPLPPPSGIEQALIFFRRSSHRTLYCGNAECPAPYLFAKRRNQKYCSAICAESSQRESKRKWWAEHGEEWRSERQTKKVSKKGRK